MFGKPPENVNVKKRIGYLPEESYLYPYLNARETLDFYARLFGIPKANRVRRTDELLEMVGLDAVQFRPIGEYSKGMQRRIGIAQALINDPDFLILDEPTSGLDPIGIRQVKDLISQLGQRGKTILLSSHLLADVEDVCDYMTILYGGRKQREGTSDQLLTTHDRTIIETGTMDDEATADIRSYIEQRTNNDVISISPARQSLESLFLDIVEKAQQDRVETFGAKSGGQTAAFLVGKGGSTAGSGESVEGDALLDKLTQDESKEANDASESAAADEGRNVGSSTSGADSTSGNAARVDDSMLDSLVDSNDRKPPSVDSSTSAAAPAPQPNVDQSVLESLVDAYGDGADDQPTGSDETEDGGEK